MTLKLGILGIDHLHILGMLSSMQEQGCTCARWWSQGDGPSTKKFLRNFPDLERVQEKRTILDDPEIGMILISAVPADRAALAIEAMEAGKDVMVDKPGCTTLEQLAAIREVQARTGRIWTVNFSERFEVPCVTRAAELVQSGAIGTVKQVLGLGPHRPNLASRPEWFYDWRRFGGILTDIGSHQIDQFLYFTGSDQVTISHALVENTTMPDRPGFQDFGEVVLTGDRGHGYFRIDWFTPDALPTWGDGRLTILGDKGYIELRKYTDIARQLAGNQLYLCNGAKMERIDCNDAGRPYFPALVADHHARTETAVPQAHTYRAMDLAIRAQMLAMRGKGQEDA